MFTKIASLFKKKEKEKTTKRLQRELLRELLASVTVDVFYHDDPLIGMSPEERKEYLMEFHLLAKNKRLIARLEYFINKQANILLKNGTSEDGTLDSGAIMTLNGITIVKNEIEKLSRMYETEEEERKIKMTQQEQMYL